MVCIARSAEVYNERRLNQVVKLTVAVMEKAASGSLGRTGRRRYLSTMRLVIREMCSQALNVLDRFHIVAKGNEALDDIRAAEARRVKADGCEPVLAKSRWCRLKRPENPHRQPEGETERSGALQPPERPRLPAQGTLPATLELRLHRLGRQPSSSTTGAAK